MNNPIGKAFAFIVLALVTPVAIIAAFQYGIAEKLIQFIWSAIVLFWIVVAIAILLYITLKAFVFIASGGKL